MRPYPSSFFIHLSNMYCTPTVMDLKYELTDHPAIRHTVDGGGPPYIHKGRHKPAFQGIPLFQAFSAGKSDEEKENAA